MISVYSLKDKIDWKLIEFSENKTYNTRMWGLTYVYVYINENKPIMVMATSNNDAPTITTRMSQNTKNVRKRWFDIWCGHRWAYK